MLKFAGGQKGAHSASFQMKTGITLLLLGIAAAIYPDLGKKGGLIHSEILTKVGVFWVFFLLGVSLLREQWIQGLRAKYVFVRVLSFQFFFSPLLMLLFLQFFWKGESEPALALFFLSILPSTVSASVLFCQKSGENPALAAMLTTTSNLFAVFTTPLWIAWYLKTQKISLPYETLFVPILWNVLLPTILGWLLHHRLGKWFHQRQKIFSQINMNIVYFILYAAFCDAFAAQIWKEIPMLQLGVIALIAILFLITSHTFLLLWGKRYDLAHRWTLVFLGAQKSIATGAPIALVLVDRIPPFSPKPPSLRRDSPPDPHLPSDPNPRRHRDSLFQK